MDGVIVDSMPYHYLAWYEALRPEGIRVTCFDVYTREGERWQKTLRELLAYAGVQPTEKRLNAIFARRKKIFKKYFKRFIFQGAHPLLRCLKARGYLLGLVTGTPLVEVQRILPKAIHDMFDCIISGDSVKQGKPHPEPYLKGAKCLGVLPRECLVVENAPYGIESAKKAGMFCVAVTTSLPKEYLSHADIVVRSLEEISGIIEQSCRLR